MWPYDDNKDNLGKAFASFGINMPEYQAPTQYDAPVMKKQWSTRTDENGDVFNQGQYSAPDPLYNTTVKAPVPFNPPTLPQAPQSSWWDQVKAGDIKGLSNNIHPSQILNDLGTGLAHGLAQTGSAKMDRYMANANADKPSIVQPFYQQQQADQQKQDEYLKSNPVNSLPGMITEQIPQIPLWMAGEGAIGALGKGLGKLAPSLASKAERVGSKLPSFVKGGLKDAATYSTIVAPTQNIQQGGNFQSLLEAEKQTPGIFLGGAAFRGVGGLIGKGISKAGNALSDPLGPITQPLDQAVSNAYQGIGNTFRPRDNPLSMPAEIPARVPLQVPKAGIAPLGQATSVLPDTASHIVSKTERQPTNFETLRTNAYIKTTDNLHRFNQLDQYVEKTTGTKLAPQDKTYMLGLNSRGTGTTASSILEENLVNPKGEVIGDSLKSITSQLKNKDTMKAFDDYLVNKHAITRMTAGEKVYPDEMAMTPEMSQAKVAEIEALHPEFKDLSTKLYDFQNKLTKSWLVDTGIVSPEAYGKWVIDNPNYVPNNRLFSELEKPGFSGGTKRGFAGQSNPVKARTGSQRQIISPIESIMEHTDQYVKVAKRNEVMQTLIRNLEKNPEEFKGWAEIIPSDGQLKEGLMGDINKTLQTQGMDGVVEQFNKQFDDIFQAKKQRLDLGNVVTGLVNGEKVHVKINDPLLLDALTNLKPQAQQVVIATLGKLTRIMKNLTTGINPIFGLTKNIFRDIPTAFINSKSTNNPLIFGKDLLGSIVDVIGNKEVYKSYKALGGGHASSSVSTSRNSLTESKARLLPGYALKHPFQTAIGGLERLNNAVETAPRLGEFKRIAKVGDYSSKIKGIYESNDVTTNFNKFGNVIKEADSVMPYLNAAWQGIDKLTRTFRDNPVQASSKALVAVTIPTIMLYQLNHTNPAYQQLSDYIKDNNFLIPKGDGTFIKIPKPREIGVVFGSSVERAMRQWQDKDPDPFNRFMETIKTNFMPPTRSILAPLNDIRSNKNFMDAPIVSGAVSRLSPRFQFDEKTSEPAKWIGNKLNQSPQQIDYLARSYLGGVAQLGIPATTKNASVAGTLSKQVTADPTFSNDIIGDFYNTLDKISTSASDAKATGDKSLELGQRYKTMFNKTNTELGKIRKQVDKVQAGVLPNQEKDAQIRVLQIQMLDIAKKANSTFKLK